MSRIKQFAPLISVRQELGIKYKTSTSSSRTARIFALLCFVWRLLSSENIRVSVRLRNTKECSMSHRQSKIYISYNTTYLKLTTTVCFNTWRFFIYIYIFITIGLLWPNECRFSLSGTALYAWLLPHMVYLLSWLSKRSNI